MAKIAFTPVVSNARGKTGQAVFTKTRSGSIIRLRVKPKNPRTVAQTTVRANLTEASRTYKGLSSSDVLSWQNYAATVTKRNAVTGQHYNPSAITAFNGLATSFLEMTPGGSIPTTPPTTPFVGDSVTITAVGGSGDITYTASAANATGVNTYLLLQKLVSANREPNPKGYRIGVIHHFVSGTLTNVISGLAPGTYAVAYKFGQVADGQTSLPVVIGKVTVS